MRINGDIAGWHKQPAGMGAQSEREYRGGKELIAERERHLVSEGLGRDDNTGIAGGGIEAVCVDLIPSGVSCSAVRRRTRQVAGSALCTADSERVHAVSQRATAQPTVPLPTLPKVTYSLPLLLSSIFVRFPLRYHLTVVTHSARPLTHPSAMSYQNKILRTANAPQTPPTEIEQQIAQALLDLEQNVPDLKSELRQLQISEAREVDVKGGKKAVVIFVPVPMAKAFHKVQQR